MTDVPWPRVADIVEAVLARPVSERAQFLLEACGDDERLRGEVEALVAKASTADGFLEHPIAAIAADVMTTDSRSLTGRRLGAFAIGPLLGAGGMGQVYRARDTTLGREVAVKVLPPEFTADADRLARFEREARVLASLNHPHIAAIYGIEQADPSTGSGQAAMRALVLELVEGETLADRIAGPTSARRGAALKARRATETHGGLPLEEALGIARQIALALEAAHDRGIVHRDLKPANVKITPAGVTKVLDFGLAKTERMSQDEAATLGLTDAATYEGVVLGTAGYMSPEQARGQIVDKRTDIWAFGCVLFEMLTGRMAFPGSTVSDRIAAVLERAPDWTALPSTTPPRIRDLLERCLSKDPANRLRDIADARIDIDRAGATADPVAIPGTTGRSWSVRVAVAVAASVLGLTFVATLALWRPRQPASSEPGPLTRLAIHPPADLPLAMQGADRDVALAPDGSFVVYRAGSQAQLVVRHLDRLEASPLANVRNARTPFVSPDGRWVGFVENNTTLKKVAVGGGTPITLATLPGAPRGAVWVDDTTIVVATNASGLLRVPAAGGEPVVLTTPDRAGGEAHMHPSRLPGGQALLFTITAGQRESSQVAMLDLQTRTSTTLIRGGTTAQYVASGHLVYGAGETLSAVRFDARQRTVIGDPVPIVEGVSVSTNDALNAAVTERGTLIYVPSVVAAPSLRSLVWVDRQGRETPIGARPGAYASLRLSPDGTRVALELREPESNVWVWDLARQTLTRLTFNRGLAPVWTPDSQRIVFASPGSGRQPNLNARAADGSGDEVRLAATGNVQVPTSVAPDGAYVISDERRPQTGSDIVRVGVDSAAGRGGAIEGLVETPSTDRNGEVSPNGRFLAFESNESGRFEIYVRPYPQVANGRWQLSATTRACSVKSRRSWRRRRRRTGFSSTRSELWRPR